MKKGIFFFIISTIITLNSYAQQLRIQSGRNLCIFDYKNSKGERLNNLQNKIDFAFSASYRTLGINKRIHFSGGFSFNRYRAVGSDTILNNYYKWQTNYLGIDLAGDVDIVKQKISFGIHERNFTVNLKTDVSTEFLISGTQTLNNKTISLIGIEEFNRPFLFVRGGISVNYYVNNDIGLYAEYMGGKSVLVIDKDKNDLESLKLITNTIYIGIAFTLPY